MERNHRTQLDQARDEAREQAREARSLAREEAEEQIRMLRDQVQDLTTNQSRGPVNGGEWKDKFQDLQRNHENLQMELKHQQEVCLQVFLTSRLTVSSRSPMKSDKKHPIFCRR